MKSLLLSCSSCGRKNKIPAAKQHLRVKCGHCGTPILIGNKAIPLELDDHTFHTFVKNAPLPILVDFFSPTCGPCQMMTPIVATMAKKYLQKCIIAKVDTSKNPGISSFFKIQGVPSFLFFKEGSLLEQVTGAVSEDVLEQKIAALL